MRHLPLRADNTPFASKTFPIFFSDKAAGESFIKDIGFKHLQRRHLFAFSGNRGKATEPRPYEIQSAASATDIHYEIVRRHAAF
jgi:hypothetical protein